jgi:hypothetical protein
MCEIEGWFNECDKIYYCGSFEFTMLNGFKITHYLDNNSYTIQDVRRNDFYTSVSEGDYSIIRDNGFIKGTSIIANSRNLSRVDMYLEKISQAFVKRRQAKKRLSLDEKFYKKQVRNCDVNIHKYNDLLHFYKAKVSQFNNNNNN